MLIKSEGRQDRQGLKAPQDRQGPMVRRVLPALQDPKVLQARAAFRESKVQLVFGGQRGLKDLRV